MDKVKHTIIVQDEKLRRKLLKALTLLGVSVCVVLSNNAVYEIEQEDDLIEIIEKHDLEELKFYSKGIEVDVEALKKQQKAYSDFGKEKVKKKIPNYKNSNVKYNPKITTKHKKYHRKG